MRNRASGWRVDPDRGGVLVMLGAPCSSCCGWYCYGCRELIASVRARVVSFPETTSDTVDSGSAVSTYSSSVSELEARTAVANKYNTLRGGYTIRSQRSDAWVTLMPVASIACDGCEYGLTTPENLAMPISSDWKVIIDSRYLTSRVAVVAYQIPTRLSVGYLVPTIQPSDARIQSGENPPESVLFGLPRFFASLSDTPFDSGGSCQFSNRDPFRVHQNATGGTVAGSSVDYAIAGIGRFASVEFAQEYQPRSVLTYRLAVETNAGSFTGDPQSYYRDWLEPVNGVRCTTLKRLQQSTTIEIEITTQ